MQRISRQVLVMVMVATAVSACGARPLLAPSALSPVTSQAYLPPSSDYPPSNGPHYGPKPYNPAPTNGPGAISPKPNPPRPSSAPKCYPHMPCL